MELPVLKKMTLTEQIMRQISAQITNGALKTGERLPTERELAQKMGVSRSRVREALRALSLIGLISIKPGGGSFVREQTVLVPEETITWVYHQEINNVEDVYAARELIETAVYVACFRNRTPEIVENLRRLVNVIIEASSTDISNSDFYQLLVDIDMYAGQSCGNSVFTKLMQTIILLRKELSLKILDSAINRENSASGRNRIISIFENGDDRLLEKALKAFYRNSQKTINPFTS